VPVKRVAVLDRPLAFQTRRTGPRAALRSETAPVEAPQEEKPLSFLEWSRRIPTAKGNLLDFDRFPFQPEMYQVFGDQEVKDADLMKSVQVGASEMLARLTLYFPDTLGLTALYVFPALKQMYDWSDTRINPLREQSSYLQSRTKQLPDWAWNKGLKRVGQGFCVYRGSESKNDLISVDADLVAMDEYDSLHPPNIPEAERRISGSAWGLIRRVGIPSDPEYGIAKRYAASDRRSWMVKCGCKEGWQPLVFSLNVEWEEDGEAIENPRVVCKRCRKPLDVLKGKWVKEHPDRSRPGFHVHRLMVPGERGLRAVIEASKLREPHLVKSFYNNDLGMPHADKTGGLDRAAIAAALSAAESFYGGPLEQVGGYRGPNYVTAGVDVASARALSVRISEHLDPFEVVGHRKRALFIGEVDSFNDLPMLMDHYGVHIMVIDHLPEMRLALGMAERYPGRVYVCHYSSNQFEPLVLDTEQRKVSVQRTPVMDAVISVMRGLRNFLPADLPVKYVEHMIAPRRVIERDEYDRTTVRYESKGPDDAFHAEVYDLVATEVLKIRMEVEAATAGPEITSLDDQLEWERSNVNSLDEMGYRAGPDMSYRPGPDGDGY
jgi:hypothetical protein